MAIAFDAKANGTSTVTTPWSWNHTCGASATLLVVGVTTSAANLVTGVKYNSVAMTQAVQVSGKSTSLWYLLAPTTGGAHSVTVTMTTTTGVWIGASSSWSGTATSAVLDTANGSSSGSSSVPTASISTAAANELIVSIIYAATIATGAPSAGWVNRFAGGWCTQSDIL